MTKDDKTNEVIRRAIETFKAQSPPRGMEEPTAILRYYAAFNTPAIWKPGIRTPLETSVPPVKMTARFKRSFGN